MTGGHMADGDEPGWREREVALTSKYCGGPKCEHTDLELQTDHSYNGCILCAFERLREALQKIAAYDPGNFRPLADEIAIWKLATDALGNKPPESETRDDREARELRAHLRVIATASLDPGAACKIARQVLGLPEEDNTQKAGEHRHGAAQDFVSYDPYGGVRVDMARYLRSPAGQAQLQALGGKKAVDQRAIDANALAEAHRMYEAEHGHPFSESEGDQRG